MTIADIRPPEDRAALHELVNDLSRRGDERRLWRHVHEDGTIVDVKLVVVGCRVRGPAGTPRAGAGRDRAAASRGAAAARRRRWRRSGSLAGGVAHDFNNLLTVIIGLRDAAHSTALDGRPATRERRRTRSRSAAERGRRSHASAARVQPAAGLRAARSSTSTPSSSETTRCSRRLLGEDIELVDDARPEARRRSSPIPGSSSRSILNLAVNARDAMPDGGTLTHRRPRTSTLDEAYAADHVDVTPGPYVAARSDATPASAWTRRRSERVFEPFFTTKDGRHRARPRDGATASSSQSERAYLALQRAGDSGRRSSSTSHGSLHP